MRITIIGGGPGGLYASILLRLADPDAAISVHERNAPDDTFGFGVVFSEATLAELEDADAVTHDALMAACARWDPVEIRYRDERIRAGGNRFAAISRHRLLRLLQDRARQLGVDLRFHDEVSDIDGLADEADLLLGADGANSTVRTHWSDRFGPSITREGSTFIWLGTSKVFDAFTFIFLETPHGLFQAHIYPFDETRSTFIVECTRDTRQAAGLDAVDAAELPPGANDEHTIAFLQELFKAHLDGHELIGNHSRWLDWHTVRTRRWSHGNTVLLGDAAHTAHFSIGSGTKLAMEDAMALAGEVARTPDLDEALLRYEAERRPRVERAQAMAADSLDWFAHSRRYWGLAPPQFAYRLLTRSTRVDHDNLRRRDPALVRAVDQWFAEASGLPAPRVVPPPPSLAPFRLRDRALANRVVVAPEHADDADDGRPIPALADRIEALARGGAGLVLVDQIAVAPDARVTPGDVGLWDAAHGDAWGEVAARADAPVGLVLGHAGPRGAMQPRRRGADRPLPRDAAWSTVSASARAYGPGLPVPHALDRDGMDRVRDEFAEAAGRVAGIDVAVLGVDMGHGRLLASFLSPLTNHRDDEWGGDLAGRLRFPLEVLEAVREAWPDDRTLVVRFTADDRQRGGSTGADAVAIARELAAHGADLLDVVSGQTTAADRPDYTGPFNASLADLVRNEADVPTLLGGGITTLAAADHLLVGGWADLVLLRPLPADPPWLSHTR